METPEFITVGDLKFMLEDIPGDTPVLFTGFRAEQKLKFRESFETSDGYRITFAEVEA